jgi:hypothetical protein
MHALETSDGVPNGSSRARVASCLIWLWLVACIAGWSAIGVVWFKSVDLREVGTLENLRKLNKKRGFVRGYYFLELENVVLQSRPTQSAVWPPDDYPVLWVDYEDALYDAPRITWPLLRLIWPDEKQGFCLFYGTIETDGRFGHFGMSDHQLTKASCIWRPIYTWFLLLMTAIPLWMLTSRAIKSRDIRRAVSA